MRWRELELCGDGLREQLSPLVRGRVFQVPSAARFDAIAESELGATRIPNLECWFPGDLPVECVDEALIVTVSRRLVTAHLEAVLEAHRRSKKRIDPHWNGGL